MKEEIITKALQYLSKTGLIGLSMGPFAAFCKMGVANIYHHFGNREGLIQSVYAEIWLRFSLEIGKISPSNEKGYKNRFFLFWNCAHNFFAKNPHFVAILQTIEAEKLVNPATTEQCEKYFKTLDEMLWKGIEKGNLDDFEALFVRKYFLENIFLSVKTLHQDPEILMGICYKGIKKK